MTWYIFRYVCGLTVLISHIAAIYMLGTTKRFPELVDQIGSILIVAPVFLLYTAPFIKYVANNANVDRVTPDERVRSLAAITMYIVIVVFCVSLIYVVAQFAYFSKFKVNDFKMWLGAVESAFGALIGIVFERLFGVAPAMTANQPEQHEHNLRNQDVSRT
ncbi:hypothetical protein [Methylobacterium sp. WSM2598]|uniref:hypothetical protein n=1 Tax=Methylobacterium sp. WSM2598 TaxID=398261 RepID=UPI0012F639D1|nr:hypothetical protein [Methylobacterium sp. WSM2598]